MIKTLHDKDPNKWQKTTLKHFKNVMDKLCHPEQEEQQNTKDEEEEKEQIVIDPYIILTTKDYLGRIPIYHAITNGANKYVVDYIKNIMVEGGVSEKFLNNIIGNATITNAENNNTDNNNNCRMIAGLYECDIDAEAWKYTTADHVKLLMKEKIKEKKKTNGTSPGGSKYDVNDTKRMEQMLNTDGGRWGNIPIFYAVYYSAKMSVVKYMFENNKYGTLNWRSDTGWTLLHYAAIWNQCHLLPYLILAYGMNENGLYVKDEDGMTALDVANDFTRKDAATILSKPFITLKEYYIHMVKTEKHNKDTTCKFNEELKTFLNIIKDEYASQTKNIEKYYDFEKTDDDDETYMFEFLENYDETFMKIDIENKNEDTKLFAKDGPALINYINLFKIWDYGSIKEEEKVIIWKHLLNLCNIALQYIDIEESDIDLLVEEYSILHLAILLKGDLDGIDFILNEEPDLTCKLDIIGRTPLHCILNNINVNDLESLELGLTYFKRLVHVKPSSATILNIDKKTPLQLICELPYHSILSIPSNANRRIRESEGNDEDQDVCNSKKDDISTVHLEIIKVLYNAMPSTTFHDQEHHDRQNIIKSYCIWPKALLWFKLLGSTYARYTITQSTNISTIHKSNMAIVHNAVDLMENNKNIVLKIMKDKENFLNEIYARKIKDDAYRNNIDECAIKVLGWHVPFDQDAFATIDKNASKLSQKIVNRYENAERTNNAGEYVLVLEPAICTLYDDINTQSFAGRNIQEVIQTFYEIVTRVNQLHKLGLVHCNIKPKNILKVKSNATTGDPSRNFKYKLADLCQCKNIGEFRSIKEEATGDKGKPISDNEKFDLNSKSGEYSSAYMAPEFAQHFFANLQPQKGIEVKPSMDIWSLGVILYELCTDEFLFKKDTSRDNLLNNIDKARLCLWHTIPDDNYLDKVFLNTIIEKKEGEKDDEKKKRTGAIKASVSFAKNLIRWCLKGKENERPSIDDIFNHPFLSSLKQKEEEEEQDEETDDEGVYEENESDHNNKPGSEQDGDIVEMKYHGFLSYPRGDGGILGANFYNVLHNNLGINLWYDMPITHTHSFEKMKKGILASDIFFVILTKDILSTQICQNAFAVAIEYNKPIQIIIENEMRFNGFDIDTEWEQRLVPADLERKQEDALRKADGEWQKAIGLLNFTKADTSSGRDIGELEKDIAKKEKVVMKLKLEIKSRENLEKIIEEVKANLQNAVPYRRLPFEQRAMLYEICKRNQWHLPPKISKSLYVDTIQVDNAYFRQLKPRCKVYVIYNSFNGDDILNEIKENIPYITFTEDINDVPLVTSYLVILTKAIRIRKRDAFFMKCLNDDQRYENVDRLITITKRHHKDSTAVYSDKDGWLFGSDEQRKEPREIADAISNHEPIYYRPKSHCIDTNDRKKEDDQAYPYRHEFNCMKMELLKQIRRMHEEYCNILFDPKKRKKDKAER